MYRWGREPGGTRRRAKRDAAFPKEMRGDRSSITLLFRLSAWMCYGDPADNGEFEMKALYYPAWGKLEVKDVPMPSPVDGEVLVRVANCGVCGSELETFREASKRRTPP